MIISFFGNVYPLEVVMIIHRLKSDFHQKDSREFEFQYRSSSRHQNEIDRNAEILFLYGDIRSTDSASISCGLSKIQPRISLEKI